ncbi:MAG TPA: aminotransferase class I/II-fold pyridoxal phosphate-dependent enzyme [Candidatus Nanoarchaeia archaeon]|nr:aminotransferase class I/II-fold pyridoxal phosphate-dependent enzyme [Candidatus Nanoarchaeia archaeon]
MKIQISNKLASISNYAFAEVENEVAKLKNLGITPIDFGVGDPKEPTPEIVRNAIKKAVDVRKTSGYPSYNGSDEYRLEVSKWIKKRFGINLDFQKEIVSTIGAKEAVFNFPHAFLNAGDYVISPNPGYPPYEKGTLFAGGKTYFVPLVKENNYLMNLEKIPRDIVKKAKILWINYPNNPTGAVATEEFFKEAVDFGHDNNIIIASDECYSEIYYSEKPHSVLEYSKEGAVAFQSLSKRSCMTGYRIGWAAGDENVISAFRKLKPNIDSGTPVFIQDAAISALQDEKHVEKSRKDYRQKRDIIVNALTSVGLESCMPEATLYIWQKTPNGINSVEFAKKLLQKEIAIVVTPGAWISNNFNGLNPGENYVRFALVPTLEETKDAAKRIMKNLK